MKTIVSLHPLVFRWAHDERTLYGEFHRIQKAAGIKLVCRESHKCTEACDYYGFHDMRRSFATLNVDRLTGDALQKVMRHKSYATTQKYIILARQLNAVVADLHVPDALAKKVGAAG